MQAITGKTIVTVAVWIGITILSGLFGYFDVLSGAGAGWMVAGAIFATIVIWE